MQKMKVAITGGIGSGKTTVLNCIKEMGYPVFSCDSIYNDVVLSENYIKSIKQIFPSAVKNGQLQRDILSKIVFDDLLAREKLNAISHPLIMKELYKRMENADANIVFAEVPLLFEGNYEKEFDKVIVIQRDLKERISSVKNRDGLNETSIQKRMEAQFDYFSKEGALRLKNCNAIILENQGSISEIKERVQKIIFDLETLS